MFTGDAGKSVLKEYLDNYDGHNVDVLKVGHHGSKENTTKAFLEAIDPEYAIIQSGENNTHSHPDVEVLNMLYNYEEDLEVYRNDNNGLITLTISETGIMEFSLENNDLSKNDIDGDGVKVTLQSPVYNYFGYAYYKKELVA
jgi:competence protein ComEC